MGTQVEIARPIVRPWIPAFAGMSGEKSCYSSGPELARRFNNQRQLAALVVFGHRVAGNGAGKTALRADRQPARIDVAGSLADATPECIESSQHRRLRADDAEHHALVFRHETQRREVAGARRIIFE